jgi:hypothetical protein
MTKKLKIHKARIDELSAVDRPAQAGALVTIMKRADPLSSAIQKALEENTGNGDDAVIESIQSLLNKAASGGKQSDEDTMPTDNPADKDAAKKDTELGDMQKSLDSLQVQLKKAQALAELNDSEKSFYKSLDADKQEAFLSKSASDRAQEVEMHKSADPVVYVSEATGEKFHKSAGDQMIAMAKRLDAAEKMAKANQEAAQMERFSKRASDEMPNIAGESSAKVQFYKHLDGASDEVKSFAAAMIKSHNELLAKSSTMTGTAAGNDDSGADANQKLVKMAKAHAKEHDVDYDTAFIAVCEQNPDLYEQA